MTCASIRSLGVKNLPGGQGGDAISGLDADRPSTLEHSVMGILPTSQDGSLT